MTNSIEIELLGHPRGKGRPRHARLANGVTITHSDRKTAEYESNLQLAAQKAMNGRPPLDGPIAIRLEAYFPVPTSWSKKKQRAALAGELRPTVVPDAANVAAITDPCNGLLWRDDKQLVELTVTKTYSDRPRLVLTVWRLFPS